MVHFWREMKASCEPKCILELGSGFLLGRASEVHERHATIIPGFDQAELACSATTDQVLPS